MVTVLAAGDLIHVRPWGPRIHICIWKLQGLVHAACMRVPLETFRSVIETRHKDSRTVCLHEDDYSSKSHIHDVFSIGTTPCRVL